MKAGLLEKEEGLSAIVSEDGIATTSTNQPQKNKLGTVLGVYLPCILGIFGAILFLRLPWAVGQLGLFGGLLMFALSGTTVMFTVLSIAAISTNGAMGGGGAYYMISRSLGAEFGGAVGLVFYAANAVGITFYLIAFAQEMQELIGGDEWMVKLYASCALLLLLGFSVIGANFFSKLNSLYFLVLMVSIVVAAVSFLVYYDFHFQGFTHNLWFLADGTPGKTGFFKVFIVCFPAMTGVMAGANMSGDLRDPGKSIGRGTIAAVVTALIVYGILVLIIAAVVPDRTALLDLKTIFMQKVAIHPAFIAAGVMASTVSSALGNLTGSGRILQALARDNLFPFLRCFRYGTKRGDEPILAVLFSWLIAQSCIFIGNLNAVATIISEFFLLVYLFTNLACFVLSITGAPNFRPRFKYFSWHTALLGSLLCGAVLFLSGAVYASISIAVLIAVFIYVHYKAPPSEWGDVTQALIYHQVRKYLLRLDERKAHPKFWRPSILLLVQDPSPSYSLNLIDFCNNLKKGGLYVIGNVLIGDLTNVGDKLGHLRNLWLDLISKFHVKAFTETCVGVSGRTAVQNLTLSAGLGGMKANTVVLPFYHHASVEPHVLKEALAATRGGDASFHGQSPVEAADALGDSTLTLPVPPLSLNDAGLHLGDSDRKEAYDGETKIGSEVGGGVMSPSAASEHSGSGGEGSPSQPSEDAVPQTVTAFETAPRSHHSGQGSIHTAWSAAWASRSGWSGAGAGGAEVRGFTGVDVVDGDGYRLMGQKANRQSCSCLRRRQNNKGKSRRQDVVQVAQHISSLYAVHEEQRSAPQREYEQEESGAAGEVQSHRRMSTVPVLADESEAMQPLPLTGVHEYMQILRDALYLGKNVLVCRSFSMLDKELIVQFTKKRKSDQQQSDGSRMRVDVWATPDTTFDMKGTFALQLQLAQVLHRTDIWQTHTALRIMCVVPRQSDVQKKLEELTELVNRFRFTADLRVIPMLGGRVRPILEARLREKAAGGDGDPFADPAVINELVRHNSEHTCLAFLPLPTLPPHTASVQEDEAYAKRVEELTRGLPPTVMVASSASTEFVTSEL